MLVIRVLLADDHPSLRAGIRARLEQEEDIQVVGEAGSGAEALRLCRALRPHVLVLDMQMPELSGVEVARHLKAEETPLRILALSAHDDAHYITKLLETGASGYLTKEESLQTIVSAVRGVGRGEEGWLSRKAAAALMKWQRSDPHADDLASTLSERELEVLRLLAGGHTNQVIGETLFIAESTVKKHVNRIYAKLGVRTRAEAVAWAWKHGNVEKS